MAARILASAFVREGKSATALPRFGFQRTGAPVVAFARFDERPIREKTQVYEPDCLVLLDPRIIRTAGIFDGVRSGAILVVNAPGPLAQQYHNDMRVIATVDATGVGLEELGAPVTSTCMLGAFVRATGWLKLHSLLSSLEQYVGVDVLEKSRRCVQRGYEESEITRL